MLSLPLLYLLNEDPLLLLQLYYATVVALLHFFDLLLCAGPAGSHLLRDDRLLRLEDNLRLLNTVGIDLIAWC